MEEDWAAGALRHLFGQSPVIRHGAHRVVMQAYDADEHVCLVESGYVYGYTIDRAGNRHILAAKGPGDLLPLANLGGAQTESLYWEAACHVRLRSIPQAVLQRAVAEDHMVARALLDQALTALRDYLHHLACLEAAGARQRIIMRIVYLRERFGVSPADGGERLLYPLSYQDLADSLSLSRETVNRTVRQLTGAQLLMKTRGRIIIRDTARLAEALAAS